MADVSMSLEERAANQRRYEAANCAVMMRDGRAITGLRAYLSWILWLPLMLLLWLTGRATVRCIKRAD